MSKDRSDNNSGKDEKSINSESTNSNVDGDRITQAEKQQLTGAPPPPKVGGGPQTTTQKTTTFDANLEGASKLIEEAGLIKDSIQNLQVNEIEQIYFNRKINPVLNVITQLSTIAVNISTTAQVYQNNAYGERHELKKALDLSEKVLNEANDLWKLVKYRIDFFFSNINPYE